MRNTRIVIGSYEIPGPGSSNSSAYDLFDMLQADGFDVFLVNLIEREEAARFQNVNGRPVGNHRQLDNVVNVNLAGSLCKEDPILVALLDKLSPQFMVATDSVAALLLKQGAPKPKLILLASRCDQIKHYLNRGGMRDFLSFKRWVERRKRNLVARAAKEAEAVEKADLIIAHSDMIWFLYQQFYPDRVKGKIYPDVLWSAEWISNAASKHASVKKPFFNRDIDVLFTTHAMSEQEDNLKLAKRITRRRKELNVHVVGETEDSGAQFQGLIPDRVRLFELMGRTKTVVSVSLFDPVSSLLYEASAMGCNLVASKNCGNSTLCNERLTVQPFNLVDFLHRIDLSVTRKFSDNMKTFLDKKCYKTISDIVHTFDL